MAQTGAYVTIIGRVGSKQNTIETKTGGMLLPLTVAVNVFYNQAEVTDWHKITLFNNAAKFGDKYIEVGDLIFVRGNLRNEKYTNKEGVEVTDKKIYSYEVMKLSSKKGSENNEGTNGFNADVPF